MGIKTYIYRREAADSPTRLVTSSGGYSIPSNSEVVVVFPNGLSDVEAESFLEKLNKGTSDYPDIGLSRYVIVCGERIPVEMYHSYRQSPSPSKTFSLQVQRWLDGQISQNGEPFLPINSRIGSGQLTIQRQTQYLSLIDAKDKLHAGVRFETSKVKCELESWIAHSPQINEPVKLLEWVDQWINKNYSEEKIYDILVEKLFKGASASTHKCVEAELEGLLQQLRSVTERCIIYLKRRLNAHFLAFERAEHLSVILDEENNTGAFNLVENQTEELFSFLLLSSTSTTTSSGHNRAGIDDRLGSLITMSHTAISSAFSEIGNDSNNIISEDQEHRTRKPDYREQLPSLDKNNTQENIEAESEVQLEHEIKETEITRFGARAKHLVELDIREEPSNPMMINQLRNVRQKWFKDEVTRIVEHHRSKMATLGGEYAIDFDTMQEEVEERTFGLNKAVHKAKKKRAFPATEVDLDRKDTRSAEQYSKDCKNLASQICQRALKELQQGTEAAKIVLLFSRGEKAQPSEKVVKPRAKNNLGVGGSIEGKYDLHITQSQQTRNYFFQPDSLRNQKQRTGRKAILDDAILVQGDAKRSSKRRKIHPEDEQLMFSFDVTLYLEGKWKHFSAKQIEEIWGHKKFLGKPDSFHLKRLKRLCEDTQEEKELNFKP